MSELPGADTFDGGTVELGVEADTTGFGKRLQQAIDRETKNVVAKVGVDFVGNLRQELTDKVREAAQGVVATVKATFDTDQLRGELQRAVTAASQGVQAEVGVKVDDKLLREQLVAAVKTAAAGVDAEVGIDVKGARAVVEKAAEEAAKQVSSPKWWQKIFRRGGKDGSGGGGPPEDADSGSVPPPPPPLPGPGGGGGLPAARRGGFALQLLIWTGMASLLQPLVSAIGGAAAGLAAMAVNLASVVSLASAIPGLMALFGLGMGAVTLAFSGLTDASKDGAPVLKDVRKAVKSLKDELADVKELVQDKFWSGFVDDIRPLGEKLLPTLGKTLAPVATSLGRFGKALTGFLGDDVFLRRFRGMGNVAARFGDSLRIALFGKSKQIDGVKESTRGLAHFLSDLEVTTRPVVDLFGDLTARFGQWTGGLLDTKAEREAFRDYLDYAIEKGAQASRIVADLTSALVGIFRHGQPTGDSLLASLEEAVSRFDDWVNSREGGQAIREFFEEIEPVAAAMGDVLVELGRSLAELAGDQNTAALLDQLANDVLPAVTTALKELGQNLGPEVIEMFENLAESLALLWTDGSILTAVLGVINTFWGGLNDFLSDNPGAAATVSGIVAALLLLNGLRTLGGKTGVLALLAGVLAGLKGGGGKALGKLGDLFRRGKDKDEGKDSGSGKDDGTGDGPKKSRWDGIRVYWTGAPLVTVANMDGGGKSNPKSRPGGVDADVDVDGDRRRGSRRGGFRFGGRGGALGGILGALGLGSLLGGAVGSGALDDFGKSGAGKFLQRALGKARGGPISFLAGLATIPISDAIRDDRRGLRDGIAGGIEGAATGAGIGGLAGGIIGSVVPGIGNAVGAGVGAGVGGTIGGAIGFLTNSDWSTVQKDWSDLWTDIGSTTQAAWAMVKQDVSNGVDVALSELQVFQRDAEGTMTVDLAAPARAMVNGMANALPAPVRDALTNLGVFKKQADGTVRVDLKGAAAHVGNTLANALPEPVKTALTNLGVFKRDAKGRVRIDLAGTGRAVVSSLAEALPGPVKTALTNLGVFKRDAKGRITVDLSGTARNIGNGLANALPAPVRDALSALGVFKRDAKGRITVDLSGTAQRIGNGLANALPRPVRSALSALGVFRTNARGYVSVDLRGTGQAIVSGLISGIYDMYSSVVAAAQSVGQWISDNKGPIEYDRVMLAPHGRAIIGGLVDTMEAQYPRVLGSLQRFTADLAGTSVGWSGTARMDVGMTSRQAGYLDHLIGSQSSSLAAAMAAGGGDGQQVTFLPGSVTIYNPTAEPASTSLAALLRNQGEFVSGPEV